jgi:nitrogen fixation protein NifU and related proteins
MYTPQVLDHYRHPRHWGELAGATFIEMTNPVCGDVMKLWARVEAGVVREATFQMEGCIPAVACGSWLVEAMRGRSPAELAEITPERIEAALGGLPSASRHACRLACDALRELIRLSRLPDQSPEESDR